jgi:hypothetical protein
MVGGADSSAVLAGGRRQKPLREREVACEGRRRNRRHCTIAHALFNGRPSRTTRTVNAGRYNTPGNASGPSLGSSDREAAFSSVAYRTDATRRVEYDAGLANLPLGRRRSDARPNTAPPPHLCRACKTHLLLIRRHTSPPRLGAPVLTEFYRCDGCDSGYAFSPATGRWKPWHLEE